MKENHQDIKITEISPNKNGFQQSKTIWISEINSTKIHQET
jgi:hypothetical protein